MIVYNLFFCIVKKETPMLSDALTPSPLAPDDSSSVSSPKELTPKDSVFFFEVLGQYIKDISFENPHLLSLLAASQTENKGDVSPPQNHLHIELAGHTVEENVEEIVLSVEHTIRQGEKTLCVTQVSYAGLFRINPDLSEEDRETVLWVQAPQYLFPFVRAHISHITQDSGQGVAWIQPIDFYALWMKKKSEQPVE